VAAPARQGVFRHFPDGMILESDGKVECFFGGKCVNLQIGNKND
jgi:hypothetical protein